MSPVEPRQALYAHLLNDPGVQAAVGNRVYQLRVPEDATKPLLLIYPPISRVPERDLQRVTRRQARIQVTAMADTQPQAEAAARAVMAAVEGFRGMMAGALSVLLATVDADRQVDEDEVKEVHHHVDVMITYSEEVT